MIKAETFANGDIRIYGYHEDGSKIAFAPIPGYANRYLASEDGDIFSFAAGFNNIKKMSLCPDDKGYLQVRLCINGQGKTRRVHQLVLEAFVGLREEGQIALHANDVRWDNRLSNLRWGTYSENGKDCVANGHHKNANKTHCNNGHSYAEHAFILKSSGKRSCKVCRVMWEEEYISSGKRAASKARQVEKRQAQKVAA